MYLKTSSAKWRPLCIGFSVLSFLSPFLAVLWPHAGTNKTYKFPCPSSTSVPLWDSQIPHRLSTHPITGCPLTGIITGQTMSSTESAVTAAVDGQLPHDCTPHHYISPGLFLPQHGCDRFLIMCHTVCITVWLSESCHCPTTYRTATDYKQAWLVMQSWSTRQGEGGIFIGLDNGLTPARCQSIIWISASLLLIRPLGTNFSEIGIKIQQFSNNEMKFKMPSAKFWQFCLNLLTHWGQDKNGQCFAVNPFKFIFTQGQFWP